jgi:hypothetical protein
MFNAVDTDAAFRLRTVTCTTTVDPSGKSQTWTELCVVVRLNVAEAVVTETMASQEHKLESFHETANPVAVTLVMLMAGAASDTLLEHDSRVLGKDCLCAGLVISDWNSASVGCPNCHVQHGSPSSSPFVNPSPSESCSHLSTVHKPVGSSLYMYPNALIGRPCITRRSHEIWLRLAPRLTAASACIQSMRTYRVTIVVTETFTCRLLVTARFVIDTWYKRCVWHPSKEKPSIRRRRHGSKQQQPSRQHL